MVPDMVADLQKECDGKLCHGSRSIGENVGYRYISLLCSFNIDHIVAGGKNPDILQLLTCIDGLFTQWCFVGDDNLCFPDPIENVFLITSVIDCQLPEFLESLPAQDNRGSRYIRPVLLSS